MSNSTDYASGAINRPIEQLDEARTRVAQLEAKLAQADYFIVNALESSIGWEDMCKKLRMAHATLKEALEGKSDLTRVA